MTNLTNWKTMLLKAMKKRGESFADVEANTMTEEDMMKEVNPGYGGEEGGPFTVWTKNTVYFPICYDGSEWVVGSIEDIKFLEDQ